MQYKFQLSKKLQGVLKRKRRSTVWREELSIKTRLKYDTDVEIIIQVIKNNYDKYVKGYNGKSREHLRTER